MSVLGGSDSATKQTTSYAPLTGSDQAVVIGLRGSSNLGPKNSGNATFRLGKGASYNPSVSYVTQGYSSDDLDRITSSFQQSVSAALTGLGQQRQAAGLSDVIEDRLGGQIIDAPDDAAKEKRNFLIIIIAMLAIAGGALFLGRKK